MNNVTAIVTMELKEKVDPSTPLDERFRTAFVAARTHWLAPNADTRFAAGCEAVYASASEAERGRIEDELRALRTVDAMLSGVPVDMDQVEFPEELIGIRRLFQESEVAP